MKTENSRKINPIKWVPSVYFGMGLPFVALSLVSVIMFSDMGISNAQATFWTSLLLLPWSLKPLWSPFLEMFKTKKHFVVLTQMITGISFALVALCLPLPDFFTYAIALMGLIAFSGATHDIAGDGLYLAELDKKAQAQYIGWQGAFYNLAKVLANGGLVYMAGQLKNQMGAVNAWMIIMGICAGVMIVLSIYHGRVLPSGGAVKMQVKSFSAGWDSFKEVFKTFFYKKNIVLYIFFIILYRLAEGFAIRVAPLFLKAPVSEGGLGLEISQLGLINGTFGTVAFILGSILAGYFISAYGLRKTLFTLCCTINLPFLVYLLLAIYQPSNVFVIGTAVVFEYFGYGFGFVGLTLFMMQQVSPGKHTMAHYAFATGIMNLGYMLPGMVSGALSEWLGYTGFFVFVAFAMIPALAVTWFVPFAHRDTKDIEGEMMVES